MHDSDFGYVLKALLYGSKVRRETWEKGSYIQKEEGMFFNKDIQIKANVPYINKKKKDKIFSDKWAEFISE